MATHRTRKQPMDFRKEEVSYVMQRWRASDSCSLIGVGSVGKSNLLQHLSNPEVQTTYMDLANADHFKAIIIDPNMLGPLPKEGGADFDQVRCWAGYELMMHRLFMSFFPFDGMEPEEVERIYDIYQSLQNGNNPLYAYMGLRHFEMGLDFFIRRGIRLVFMFDEFEDMLRYLPVKFFQTLRGLRDVNKRYLSYLTFTRAPLPALVNKFGLPELEIESFIELFTDGLYYVGPYNPVDGRRMAENLMNRNQKYYSDDAVEFLMWATGRYAGLMRSTFRLMDALGPLDSTSRMNDEIVRILVKRRSIREECTTLWKSLSEIEHYVLRAVAGLHTYEINSETERGVAMLVQKRLLRVDRQNQRLHIEPPVFRVFVASNPDIDMDGN